MNVVMSAETDDDAALLVNQFFQRIAPDDAAKVANYVLRLFRALEDGHSFIYLNETEVAQAQSATQLVGQCNTPLILQSRRLFIAKFYELERQLAQEINRLTQQTVDLSWSECSLKLQKWFSQKGGEDQQAAAALALISPFILISGGPGTGKTTTVAKLLALLCQNQKTLPEIQLAAPTGKAAARMTDALHRAVAQVDDLSVEIREHLDALNAKTVHRLLGLSPPQMQPRLNAVYPMSADILLIDEASMLDGYLFWQLLQAVPNHCRVILLGDVNQLPAVGMGAVLQSLSQTPALTHTQQTAIQTLLPQRKLPENLAQQHAHLRISHRFDADSEIGQLAGAVLQADGERAWALLQQATLLSSDLNARHSYIAQHLFLAQQHYWQAIEQRNFQAAFKALNDIVVLTTTRADAQSFNVAYRQVLQQNGLCQEGQDYFVGQVIMVRRNDAAQNVFNGDVGIIVERDGRLFAAFEQDTQLRLIALNQLPESDDAFAMTVHKSQGSEYYAVWLIAPSQESVGFSQALLYTAITRAKKEFVYYGSQNHFQAACSYQEMRRSALSDFLDYD